jgi:hypothetical protein
MKQVLQVFVLFPASLLRQCLVVGSVGLHGGGWIAGVLLVAAVE